MIRKIISAAKILATLVFVLTFNACSKDTTPVSRLTGPPPTEGQIIKDVIYGSNADWHGKTQELALDIYMPAHMEAGKKYPLAIFVHGGSYLVGDKASGDSKCSIYADSGFVAASINYRLGWSADSVSDCMADTASTLEAVYRAMQDINASIRYLVANADYYRIDPNWIFVSGSSAGAVGVQTSSYETDAYVEQRYPQLFSKLGHLQNADNNFTNTYTIKGICSIAGALLDSNLINSFNAIPTIFFQGDADQVVPVDHGTYLYCPNYFKLYGSLCLYRRLVANNKAAVAHILPGGGHGNNGESGYTDAFMIGNAACFFHTVMRGEVQQGIFMGTIDSCP